jgi:gliding motility-associated-like protein
MLQTKLCYLDLPNIITPTGDGKNDRFEVIGIEYFPNSTMKVYNRWGKKIFEDANYTSESFWDGGNAADGVYYYVLEVNYGENTGCMEAKNFNGTITIIR